MGMAKLYYHLWLCEDPLPSLHIHSSKHMLNVCATRVFIALCMHIDIFLHCRAGVSVVSHY